MKRIKKLLLSLLCFGMLVSAPLAVFAEGDEGTDDTSKLGDQEATTTIDVSTDPATIDVTVPTNLAFAIDNAGKLTGPSTFTVRNKGVIDVKLTTIAITGNDGWELTSEKPTDWNSKKMHITINSTEAVDGVYTLNKLVEYDSKSTSASSRYKDTYISIKAEGSPLYTKDMSQTAAYTMTMHFTFADKTA